MTVAKNPKILRFVLLGAFFIGLFSLLAYHKRKVPISPLFHEPEETTHPFETSEETSHPSETTKPPNNDKNHDPRPFLDILEALAPLDLSTKICNVSKINSWGQMDTWKLDSAGQLGQPYDLFQNVRTQMYTSSMIPLETFPSSTSDPSKPPLLIGYYPFIEKCATTTVKRELDVILREYHKKARSTFHMTWMRFWPENMFNMTRPPKYTRNFGVQMKKERQNAVKLYDVNPKSIPTDAQVFSSIKDFYHFSFIRHPLDRFLSGYHEWNYFQLRGWVNPLEDWGLSFFKTNCFHDKTYPQKCEQDPSTPQIPLAFLGTANYTQAMYRRDRLLRLDAFLDDITKRLGWFDNHINPLTWVLRDHGFGTAARNQQVFDIKDVSIVFETIRKKRGLRSKRTRLSNRANDAKFPWIVSSEDLATWVNSENPDALARRVFRRLCVLLKEDFDCLPYDAPPFCSSSFL